MSLSYQPLQPVAVLDPRLQVENQRAYAVLEGGSTVTAKQWTTQSISTSSLQWSAPPPSGAIFMDRKVQLYVPVRITMTGNATAAGQTLLNSGFDAPRSWPLSGAIETIQATINNQSVSINLADVIHPLTWFNSEEALRAQDWSTTPVFPDQSQSYASLTGSILNPLGDIGNAIPNHEQPRGCFPFVIVSNPISVGAGPLTAVVDLAMSEFLILNPFAWSKGTSSSGLVNVTSLDLNISMVGQNAANRMWSHCPPVAVSVPQFPPLNNQIAFTSTSFVFGGTPGGPDSFGTTTGNQPFLLATYITPKDTMQISPNIPITYPYSEVVRYITQGAKVPPFGAAGSKNVTLTSNNIQISSWPARMYIFAREQNQDLYASASNTDTYFQINNASLTVANKNGLLASANAEQLYQMAVKNGYQGSWTQWNGVTTAPGGFGAVAGIAVNPQPQIGLSGSIMCVEFATDLGLDSLQAPGKLEQTQLSVQLTISNLSPKIGADPQNPGTTPSLYIILVNEGTFTVQRLGASTTNIGVLSSQNILDAKQQPAISLKDVESNQGGDFFSGLKSINDFLKQHKVLSRYVAPALGALSFLPGPQSVPLKLAALGGPLAAYHGYGNGGARRAAPRGKPAPRRRMRQGRIGYGAGDDDDDCDYEDEGYGGESITNEQLSEHIDY